MVLHSVQPSDRIFGKGCAFLSFAKNMGKNIGKNITKNLSGKNSQKIQKQQVIWLVIKLLIELQKCPKINNKIIQKQLHMNMIKKYLKKDICLQKKTRKIIDDLRLIY